MKRIAAGIICLLIQGYPVSASDILEKNYLSPSTFIEENPSGEISYAPLSAQIQGFLDMNNHDQLSSKLSLMMVERVDETSTDLTLENLEQDLRKDIHYDSVSGNTDIDFSMNIPQEDFFQDVKAIPPPEEYSDVPLLWVQFNIDKEGGIPNQKEFFTYDCLEWYEDNFPPLFINEDEKSVSHEQIKIRQGQPILVWDMDNQIYMTSPLKSVFLPAVKYPDFELQKDEINGGKEYLLDGVSFIQDTFTPYPDYGGYFSLANMVSMNRARKEGWINVFQGNALVFTKMEKTNASRYLPFNYIVSEKNISHFTRLKNPVYAFDDDGNFLTEEIKTGKGLSENSNCTFDSHSENPPFRPMMEYEIYHLESMAEIFAQNRKTSWNQEFFSLLKMYLEKASEWKYFIEGFNYKQILRDELIKRYKFSSAPKVTGNDLSNVLKTLYKISYGREKLFSKYIKVEHIDPDENHYEIIQTFKNKMLELLNDLSFYEIHQNVVLLSEKGEAKKFLNELLNEQIFLAGESGVKLKSSLSIEEKTKVRRFNLQVMEELYPDVLRTKHKNCLDSAALNQLLKSAGLAEYSTEILDTAKQKFFDMSIPPSTTHGNFLEKVYLLMTKECKLSLLQIHDLLNDSDFLDIWNQKLCYLRSLKKMDLSSDAGISS